MYQILEVAIALEQLAKALRESVSTGRRENIARDLAKVSGISLASALEMVDIAIIAHARKALQERIKPLM